MSDNYAKFYFYAYSDVNLENIGIVSGRPMKNSIYCPGVIPVSLVKNREKLDVEPKRMATATSLIVLLPSRSISFATMTAYFLIHSEAGAPRHFLISLERCFEVMHNLSA